MERTFDLTSLVAAADLQCLLVIEDGDREAANAGWAVMDARLALGDWCEERSLLVDAVLTRSSAGLVLRDDGFYPLLERDGIGGPTVYWRQAYSCGRITPIGEWITPWNEAETPFEYFRNSARIIEYGDEWMVPELQRRLVAEITRLIDASSGR